MDEYYDDIPRYKKKTKRPRTPKSNHKHIYQNCVFKYGDVLFWNKHGFVNEERMSIGTYCPICGKIGTTFADDWTKHLTYWPSSSKWKEMWSEEALREFEESTRTLPMFTISDIFQKKIEIETSAVPA